jgi:hypothetical protein
MPRTIAELPKAARISDDISLEVISKTFPREKITAILERTGKASVRQRELLWRVKTKPRLPGGFYLSRICPSPRDPPLPPHPGDWHALHVPRKPQHRRTDRTFGAFLEDGIHASARLIGNCLSNGASVD